MGKELVLYSEELFQRGVYGRLQGIIDICSKRKEIDAKANDICSPYGFRAMMVLAPTTGVKGDDPDYGCLMEIRGRNMDYKDLEKISGRITNEIRGITRVVVLLSEQ